MPARRILANIMPLLDNAFQLYLDADVVSGASTLTVQSILGVAANNILLIREPGSEFAEIIAATGASGNTVNLATGLVESHPAGTVIYVIPANQVRFFHATTEVDANSDDSTLVALAAAQAIDPTSISNHFDDTTYTSGWYYYRFQDSVNALNMLYSDPIPWAIFGPKFATNKVGYVLDFVQRKLGFDWGGKFTKATAIDEINACFNYIDGKQLHWPKHFVADFSLGVLARGIFDFALPSDIYDNETNKSVLQIKIAGEVVTLTWKDEKEFDELMGQAVHTTVRTQPSVGDTTLAIVNSYNFADDGTVHAFTSNTDDEITYTGVTRSGTLGVLTGVPASGAGSIAATHAVGINVWQNHQEGQPLYFNIRQGRIRFWPMPDSSWINKDLQGDYYTAATQVDSESDTLDVERYDMVKHWLLWKAKSYLQRDGKDDLTDADYLEFRDILTDAIKKKNPGQKFKWKPKINTISYRGRRSGNFDVD